MKCKKIYTSDITEVNPYPPKGYPTDFYYTQLANKLLEDFSNSDVDLGNSHSDIIRLAAITLTKYMEDIVADSGQWRMFSYLCQQMFGWPVPMYHDEEEEYYPDEPSLMAVRYLIWHAATETDDIWWEPDLDELDELANIAYQRLCDEFEKAPVNVLLAEDINTMLRESEEDFNKIRFTLIWLTFNSYLIHTVEGDRLLFEHIKDADSLKDIMTERRMRLYYIYMNCIFAYKFGPLALNSKEYIAALARVKSMDKLAKALDEIETIPMRAFQYSASEDGKKLNMQCTNGKTIEVARDEIMISDKRLFKTNYCMSSFIYFQGEWHLNGVFSALDGTEGNWDTYCKKDPDYIPEGQINADANWYLKHTGGKQLFFFKDATELKNYMVKNWNFNKDMLADYGKEAIQNQPTMVFINKEGHKDNLHLSYGYCPYIKAPDNPFYNPQTAAKEAVEILWNDGVSTETALYLLDKGYLPDLINNELISQKGSLQTRVSDARFLLRYMRQHKY